MVSAEELGAYLHEHIPISAYMSAMVLEATVDRVRLAFPLEPNINHRQSVFGGSESSAAILAAWSLLWVRCREEGISARLVISENHVVYSKPILGDFVAETLPLDNAAWSKFLATFQRRGLARIEIGPELFADDESCATFTGAFVALKHSL